MWKLAEDTISVEEIDALATWLRKGPRLTQGEEVRGFEAEWSEWLGTGHSVMVNSGSNANFALVAVASRRVERPRPRIGVSAVTWPTNVTPSLFLGHEIVVFDIDRSTLGVRADQVCPAMRQGEIDILFVTHLLGLNALTDEILATATDCGVVLLEDVCESHGAAMGERKAGTIGLGSTFSFYYGHHLATIEGGMVCTADEDLADHARLIRSHGLARESRRFAEFAALHPEIDPRFLFVTPGLNLRSTDLNAFLGRGQLPLLDARIAARNANLMRLLDGAPEWLWRDYRTEGVSSFALPLIAEDADGAGRVRRTVADLGIESRPVVAGNLLRQPVLQGRNVTVAAGGTPIADHVHAHGVYVGNGHHVTGEMVDRLCEALA